MQDSSSPRLIQFSQAGCWRSHFKWADVAWADLLLAYAFGKLGMTEECDFEYALLVQKMRAMSQARSGVLDHRLLSLLAASRWFGVISGDFPHIRICFRDRRHSGVPPDRLISGNDGTRQCQPTMHIGRSFVIDLNLKLIDSRSRRRLKRYIEMTGCLDANDYHETQSTHV